MAFGLASDGCEVVFVLQMRYLQNSGRIRLWANLEEWDEKRRKCWGRARRLQLGQIIVEEVIAITRLVMFELCCAFVMFSYAQVRSGC